MHAFAPKPGATSGPAKGAAPARRALVITRGGVGDALEREADRVAERAARAPDPHPSHACACGGTCEACRKRARTGPRLQTLRAAPDTASGADARGGGEAPEIVHQVLGSPGRPLDPGTRGRMESGLGHDFSRVRVHTDARAAASARAVHALAYTVGNDVVFGAGRYAPGTPEGRRLLAHELVHTVQQGQGAPLLQRTGAGNCALAAETVDERRDEAARAGRAAHLQIQGFFSDRLKSEALISRATKDQSSATCPPLGTPFGKADLWSYGGGLSAVEVGEIKSIHGIQHAQPDVDHYRRRLGEMAGRFGSGSPCPGPAGADDRRSDRDWLDGSLAAGRTLSFNPLASVIPTNPPTRLGPFWGDPLRKLLHCERRAAGAVAYWCTPRGLTQDEQDAERVRLEIPAGEWVRRTAPQTGTRAPRGIVILPGFDEIQRQLPAQAPAGRLFTVAVPEPLFTEVDGARRMQQAIRLMQVDPRANTVMQFRLLTWGTLGTVLAVGTLAAITAAVALAAPAAATVAAGGAAAGGTGAAGGGGVVIPLFTQTAAREIARAAAVLIVSGSMTAGMSEAQAGTAVQRGMANPEVIATLDVTDDPHALSGGALMGASVTVNDRPYRVVARFNTM